MVPLAGRPKTVFKPPHNPSLEYRGHGVILNITQKLVQRLVALTDRGQGVHLHNRPHRDGVGTRLNVLLHPMPRFFLSQHPTRLFFQGHGLESRPPCAMLLVDVIHRVVLDGLFQSFEKQLHSPEISMVQRQHVVEVVVIRDGWENIPRASDGHHLDCIVISPHNVRCNSCPVVIVVLTQERIEVLARPKQFGEVSGLQMEGHLGPDEISQVVTVMSSGKLKEVHSDLMVHEWVLIVGIGLI